ncbi:MAG TPA: hypothetical protein VM123_21675 [archaeon]|nr:hypothetical protein [archaeon]
MRVLRARCWFPTVIACFILILSSCEKKPKVPEKEAPVWQVLGPGGGGSHFECTVSPHDSNFVFSRCDMTGAQVTYDGGRTWRMFNLRTVIYDFEFDPRDPNTVYASNTGLYLSENRGRTWRLIYPAPDNVLTERMVGDHADQWFETKDGMPDGMIEKIRVDPANIRQIFIGLAPPRQVTDIAPARFLSDSAKILISTDRGARWRLLARVPGHSVLAIFPGSWKNEPDKIVVITDRACARISKDTGELTALPLPVERIRAATGGKGTEGSIFYILSDMRQEEAEITGGIYRTTDFGESWIQVNQGLLDNWPVTASLPYFKTLAACESAPGVVYLSAHIYIDEIEWKPNRPKRDRKFGIFKTETAGDNWFWVYRASEDTIYSDNFTGAWENQSYGPEWGESPHSFGVYPANPDICYVTDNRTYRTTDGGVLWEQIYSDGHPDGSWSSRGIDVTTTYGVHFDPFDKNHLFVTYTDIGLWHSFNSGKSWLHSLRGIPREWINTCYWLVFDPEVKGRVFSVRSNCHDLPRLKMFRSGSLSRGEYQGGVAVSNDGGLSWQVSNKGIPPNTVCTHILLDPDSPANSRTLYICGFHSGVYKSIDDGRIWKKASNGLGPNPNAWRMVRTPEETLYLVVARGLENGEITDGALFRSDNEAESWRPVPLPEGVNGPNDLVCDPQDPKKMYLSCWPRPKDGREQGGGLLYSPDGGETWRQIFFERYHVYAAAVHPEKPETIIINTFDSAAMRTNNRGVSWYRLDGYDFKWGHRPVLDPHNPDMLYLTTFGGSVFYGPADRVPGQVEVIENLPIR